MTSIKVIIDDQPLSISEVEQVLKQKSDNASTADKEKIREALEKMNTLRKDLLVLTLAGSTDERVGEIKFNHIDDLYIYLDELFAQISSLAVDNFVINFAEQVAYIETEYVNLYCGTESETTLVKVVRKVADEKGMRAVTVATLITEKGDWDTVAESMKSLAFNYRTQA